MKCVLAGVVFGGVALYGVSACAQSETEAFKALLKQYEASIIPLSTAANIADYDAAVSGKDEDYARVKELRIQIARIHADKDTFNALKKLKDSGAIADPVLKRELDLMENAFWDNQVDSAKLEAEIALQTGIEQKFATYRAVIDGKPCSDNALEETLRTSTDSAVLRQTWEASKQVGNYVRDDLLRLIDMRNDMAREVGFKNYHDMKLRLAEQDPDAIEALFDQLDALTRDRFKQIKETEIDPFLAARLKISPDDLMPWDYQNRFFQDAPAIYPIDLDQYYKGKDIAAIGARFNAGIGIDVSDVLARSDLYEKEGKQQHAFSTNIDRSGDVRIFMNVRDNAAWMETTLHELGHAGYEKFCSKADLPWLLRDEAHTFVTEAIAILFGGYSCNPHFLQALLGLPEEEAAGIAKDASKMNILGTLVFSRWSQVVYRFEKALYADPHQDLNALWWDLVETYQMVKRPPQRDEPDWAAKIHIATYPCYYHNYLLGHLLAAQLNACIVRNVLRGTDFQTPDYVQKNEIGKFLVDNLYSYGALYPWNEVIKKTTGEELTPAYYADLILK